MFVEVVVGGVEEVAGAAGALCLPGAAGAAGAAGARQVQQDFLSTALCSSDLRVKEKREGCDGCADVLFTKSNSFDNASILNFVRVRCHQHKVSLAFLSPPFWWLICFE